MSELFFDPLSEKQRYKKEFEMSFEGAKVVEFILVPFLSLFRSCLWDEIRRNFDEPPIKIVNKK